MNKQSVSLFLELLQYAVWNKQADEKLFRKIDTSVWNEIFTLAELQTVTALIYDGLMQLPEHCRPEKKIVYKLYLQSEIIEQSNDLLIKELKELSVEYQKLNCPFVLLKGQGNALLYPNPKHRLPGDIDLYFYHEGDYEKANDWVRKQGYQMDSENIHHQAFEFNNIRVENHKDICYFGVRKYDILLKKEIGEIVQNQRFIELNIDGLNVKVLPVEFNAFFIFYHLFHHFIHLGIGLRQFYDWLLFMSTHVERMDKKVFINLAESFDLLNAMKIFASVAVKYLGAKPSVFPFETDVHGKFVDLIMDDVLSGGNFGYEVFKKRKFKNELHRKWFSFQFSTRRIRRISGIAPGHIISLPLNKIITNLKLLLKNKC